MRTGMLWLTLLISLPLQADIYRWTDAEGRVHFGEKPPAGHTAERVQSQPLNTMPPPPEVPSLINWREREQQVKEERLQQRQRAEREQARQNKQEERCQSARGRLQEFERHTYRDTSLEALQKRLRRRDTLRRRVDELC